MLHLTWIEAESCKSSCCRRELMDEELLPYQSFDNLRTTIAALLNASQISTKSGGMNRSARE